MFGIHGMHGLLDHQNLRNLDKSRETQRVVVYLPQGTSVGF